MFHFNHNVIILILFCCRKHRKMFGTFFLANALCCSEQIFFLIRLLHFFIHLCFLLLRIEINAYKIFIIEKGSWHEKLLNFAHKPAIQNSEFGFSHWVLASFVFLISISQDRYMRMLFAFQEFAYHILSSNFFFTKVNVYTKQEYSNNYNEFK